MWAIWIYFYLSTSALSGVLGKPQEETKLWLVTKDLKELELEEYEDFDSENPKCAPFKGFKDDPCKPPTHDFKFVSYNETSYISRNDSFILPCVFRNLVGDDIVWKKGEKIFYDGDNFTIENYKIDNKTGLKYKIFSPMVKCNQFYPGKHIEIQNVQHEDAGDYFCEIKSSPYQLLTKITLKVVDTEFITKNQTFVVAEGDTVTLPCDVKDIGGTYFPMWFLNYHKQSSGGAILITTGHEHRSFEPRLRLVEGKKELLDDGIGYHLQIKNITQDLAGDYSCVLRDKEPPQLITHKVIVKN